MSCVVIIDAHPDPRPGRLIHALADAYAQGAESAGHEVLRIAAGGLEFPLLRQAEDFWHGRPPAVIADCQRAIARADHLVILLPLWLTAVPALTQAFIEQVIRPGFAFQHAATRHGLSRPLLKGRSARVVITMGMPVLLYRVYLRAHSFRVLRFILRFSGIRPVRASFFGSVEAVSPQRRARWLMRMQRLGRLAR